MVLVSFHVTRCMTKLSTNNSYPDEVVHCLIMIGPPALPVTWPWPGLVIIHILLGPITATTTTTTTSSSSSTTSSTTTTTPGPWPWQRQLEHMRVQVQTQIMPPPPPPPPPPPQPQPQPQTQWCHGLHEGHLCWVITVSRIGVGGRWLSSCLKMRAAKNVMINLLRKPGVTALVVLTLLLKSGCIKKMLNKTQISAWMLSKSVCMTCMVIAMVSHDCTCSWGVVTGSNTFKQPKCLPRIFHVFDIIETCY